MDNPQKCAALQPQRVEEARHVAPELLDRVGTRGDGRPAVAAGVVPQHAEPGLQGRHLRVPHREVRSHRVGEDDQGGVRRAAQLVVHAEVTRLDEGHQSSRLP